MQDLMKNEYIKGFVQILTDEELDEQLHGLSFVLENIEMLSSRLKKLVDSCETIKCQLKIMPEHPMLTEFETHIHKMDFKMNDAKEYLESMEMDIINGAKRTIDSFAKRGYHSIDSGMVFMDLEDELKILADNLIGTEKELNRTLERLEQTN